MKKVCNYLKKIWTNKTAGYLCTPKRKEGSIAQLV